MCLTGLAASAWVERSATDAHRPRKPRLTDHIGLGRVAAGARGIRKSRARPAVRRRRHRRAGRHDQRHRDLVTGTATAVHPRPTGSLDEPARRLPQAKLATIGFCFGGGLTWSLLTTGEPRLAAAAPFYCPAPPNPDFSRSDAAVLAVYAEHDARVNATRAAAQAARARGSVSRNRRLPGHGPRVLQRHRTPHNPGADAQAWQSTCAGSTSI
ncbi:MAG: dienelactone hydrolase family protein [Egibacteraceae bacterium]